MIDYNIFAEALRIADEERRRWESDSAYRKAIMHERIVERARRGKLTGLAVVPIPAWPAIPGCPCTSCQSWRQMRRMLMEGEDDGA